MGHKYSNSILFKTGIKLKASLPIDDRIVIESEDDFVTPSVWKDKYVYPGMIVSTTSGIVRVFTGSNSAETASAEKWVSIDNNGNSLTDDEIRALINQKSENTLGFSDNNIQVSGDNNGKYQWGLPTSNNVYALYENTYLKVLTYEITVTSGSTIIYACTGNTTETVVTTPSQEIIITPTIKTSGDDHITGPHIELSIDTGTVGYADKGIYIVRVKASFDKISDDDIINHDLEGQFRITMSCGANDILYDLVTNPTVVAVTPNSDGIPVIYSHEKVKCGIKVRTKDGNKTFFDRTEMLTYLHGLGYYGLDYKDIHVRIYEGTSGKGWTDWEPYKMSSEGGVSLPQGGGVSATYSPESDFDTQGYDPNISVLTFSNPSQIEFALCDHSNGQYDSAFINNNNNIETQIVNINYDGTKGDPGSTFSFDFDNENLWVGCDNDGNYSWGLPQQINGTLKYGTKAIAIDDSNDNLTITDANGNSLYDEDNSHTYASLFTIESSVTGTNNETLSLNISFNESSDVSNFTKENSPYIFSVKLYSGDEQYPEAYGTGSFRVNFAKEGQLSIYEVYPSLNSVSGYLDNDNNYCFADSSNPLTITCYLSEISSSNKTKSIITAPDNNHKDVGAWDENNPYTNENWLFTFDVDCATKNYPDGISSLSDIFKGFPIGTELTFHNGDDDTSGDGIGVDFLQLEYGGKTFQWQHPHSITFKLISNPLETEVVPINYDGINGHSSYKLEVANESMWVAYAPETGYFDYGFGSTPDNKLTFVLGTEEYTFPSTLSYKNDNYSYVKLYNSGNTEISNDVVNFARTLANDSTEVRYEITCSKRAEFTVDGAPYRIEFNEKPSSNGKTYECHGYSYIYFTDKAFDEIVPSVDTISSYFNTSINSYAYETQQVTYGIRHELKNGIKTYTDCGTAISNGCPTAVTCTISYLSNGVLTSATISDFTLDQAIRFIKNRCYIANESDTVITDVDSVETSYTTYMHPYSIKFEMKDNPQESEKITIVYNGIDGANASNYAFDFVNDACWMSKSDGYYKWGLGFANEATMRYNNIVCELQQNANSSVTITDKSGNDLISAGYLTTAGTSFTSDGISVKVDAVSGQETAITENIVPITVKVTADAIYQKGTDAEETFTKATASFTLNFQDTLNIFEITPSVTSVQVAYDNSEEKWVADPDSITAYLTEHAYGSSSKVYTTASDINTNGDTESKQYTQFIITAGGVTSIPYSIGDTIAITSAGTITFKNADGGEDYTVTKPHNIKFTLVNNQNEYENVPIGYDGIDGKSIIKIENSNEHLWVHCDENTGKYVYGLTSSTDVELTVSEGVFLENRNIIYGYNKRGNVWVNTNDDNPTVTIPQPIASAETNNNLPLIFTRYLAKDSDNNITGVTYDFTYNSNYRGTTFIAEKSPFKLEICEGVSVNGKIYKLTTNSWIHFTSEKIYEVIPSTDSIKASLNSDGETYTYSVTGVSCSVREETESGSFVTYNDLDDSGKAYSTENDVSSDKCPVAVGCQVGFSGGTISATSTAFTLGTTILLSKANGMTIPSNSGFVIDGGDSITDATNVNTPVWIKFYLLDKPSECETITIQYDGKKGPKGDNGDSAYSLENSNEHLWVHYDALDTDQRYKYGFGSSTDITFTTNTKTGDFYDKPTVELYTSGGTKISTIASGDTATGSSVAIFYTLNRYEGGCSYNLFSNSYYSGNDFVGKNSPFKIKFIHNVKINSVDYSFTNSSYIHFTPNTITEVVPSINAIKASYNGSEWIYDQASLTCYIREENENGLNTYKYLINGKASISDDTGETITSTTTGVTCVIKYNDGASAHTFSNFSIGSVITFTNSKCQYEGVSITKPSSIEFYLTDNPDEKEIITIAYNGADAESTYVIENSNEHLWVHYDKLTGKYAYGLASSTDVELTVSNGTFHELDDTHRCQVSGYNKYGGAWTSTGTTSSTTQRAIATTATTDNEFYPLIFTRNIKDTTSGIVVYDFIYNTNYTGSTFIAEKSPFKLLIRESGITANDGSYKDLYTSCWIHFTDQAILELKPSVNIIKMSYDFATGNYTPSVTSITCHIVEETENGTFVEYNSMITDTGSTSYQKATDGTNISRTCNGYITCAIYYNDNCSAVCRQFPISDAIEFDYDYADIDLSYGWTIATGATLPISIKKLQKEKLYKPSTIIFSISDSDETETITIQYDGIDGIDGKQGKFLRGPFYWSSDVKYYNNNSYIDLVTFSGDSKQTIYECQIDHTSDSEQYDTWSANSIGNSALSYDGTTYWKKLDKQDLVATDLLYAMSAKIDNLTVNKLITDYQETDTHTHVDESGNTISVKKGYVEPHVEIEGGRFEIYGHHTKPSISIMVDDNGDAKFCFWKIGYENGECKIIESESKVLTLSGLSAYTSSNMTVNTFGDNLTIENLQYSIENLDTILSSTGEWATVSESTEMASSSKSAMTLTSGQFYYIDSTESIPTYSTVCASTDNMPKTENSIEVYRKISGATITFSLINPIIRDSIGNQERLTTSNFTKYKNNTNDYYLGFINEAGIFAATSKLPTSTTYKTISNDGMNGMLGRFMGSKSETYIPSTEIKVSDFYSADYSSTTMDATTAFTGNFTPTNGSYISYDDYLYVIDCYTLASTGISMPTLYRKKGDIYNYLDTGDTTMDGTYLYFKYSSGSTLSIMAGGEKTDYYWVCQAYYYEDGLRNDLGEVYVVPKSIKETNGYVHQIYIYQNLTIKNSTVYLNNNKS